MSQANESPRETMVLEQLVPRGITDPRVLDAMRRVPRENFMPEALRALAYADRPLPIGHGATISQPYIVARMAELADIAPEDHVLEVGAGCGYATAVLAQLSNHVHAIEIVPDLCRCARTGLDAVGLNGIEVVCRDGSVGLPEHAPYDAIVVSAGAPRLPRPLLLQLANGGRLVIPVGVREHQRLQLVRRLGDHFDTVEIAAVAFVDLVGREGWA